MKRILLMVLATVGVMVYASPAQALILNTSESITIEFTTLTFDSATTILNQGGVTVNMLNNLLDTGESIRLELYEDSLTPGDLFYSNDFTSPTDHFGVTSLGDWQDLQGLFTLTMLSGSVNLDNYQVQVIRDDERYLQTFQFPDASSNAIPEPASLLLFTGGLLGMSFRRKSA